MSNPESSEDVRISDDDKIIIAELKRRKLWQQFVLANKIYRQKNSAIIDRVGNPGRTDMFVRFVGHSDPNDNRLLWISVANNPVDVEKARQVFLETIGSIGEIGSIEEIIKSDQLIPRSDQDELK